jgi:hypothetical protein
MFLASLLGLGRREVGLNFYCPDMLGTRVLEEAGMLGPIVLVIVPVFDGFDNGRAINDHIRGCVVIGRQKGSGKFDGQELGSDRGNRPLRRYTGL